MASVQNDMWPRVYDTTFPIRMSVEWEELRTSGKNTATKDFLTNSWHMLHYRYSKLSLPVQNKWKGSVGRVLYPAYRKPEFGPQHLIKQA